METAQAPPRFEPGQEKSPFVIEAGGFVAPENVQKCTVESTSWKNNFKFLKGCDFVRNVDWKKIVIIILLILLAFFILTISYVLVSTYLAEPTLELKHQIQQSRHSEIKSAQRSRPPVRPVELVEAVVLETPAPTTMETTTMRTTTMETTKLVTMSGESTTVIVDIETTQDKLHPMEYFGKNFDKNHASDCMQHLASGAESGIYPIERGENHMTAYCDMNKAGGGWTVIQRRVNKKEGFYNRLYDDYANGFGSLNDSFWLGLDNIYSLAPSTDAYVTLRIELHGDLCLGKECYGDPEGFWFGEWDFKIGNKSEGYKLDISPAIRGNLSVIGNNTDGFYQKSNGMMFSTLDKDQDIEKSLNCAQFRNYGGWWHSDCSFATLNGLYGDRKSVARYMMWKMDEGRANGRLGLSYVIHPKESLMMIRPKF